MENKNQLFKDLFAKKDYIAASQIKLSELSDDPDLILRLAFCLLNTQKLTEVLEVLKEKQELCHNSYFFHSLCGEVFFQQKKLQAAFRSFSHALKLKPSPSQQERINYFINKIKEQAHKTTKPESKSELDEIEKLFAEKRYHQVIEKSIKILEENPLHVLLMEKLGLSYYQNNSFKEAQETFETLAQIEPNKHEHYYHAAISAIEAADIKSAVIALKKAILRNPIHQKSYYALAGIYQAHQLKPEARQLLREILTINPFTDIADKAEKLLQ